MKSSEGSNGSSFSSIALAMIIRCLFAESMFLQPRSQKLSLCSCMQNLAALFIFPYGTMLMVENGIMGITASDINISESDISPLCRPCVAVAGIIVCVVASWFVGVVVSCCCWCFCFGCCALGVSTSIGIGVSWWGLCDVVMVLSSC